MAGKRSIFEEVGAERAATVRPEGGMIAAPAQGARGAIRVWLVVIFLMVAAMIAVGGLTRLTDSGLSITEWRPVMGALPPLNEADWADQFAKYQASPQFKLMNSHMELAEFKVIFWWEWGHRQSGAAGWAGLGAGLFLLCADAAGAGGVDAAAVGAGRAGWFAGRDWLVDGVVGVDRGDGVGGVVPVGDASGVGVYHFGAVRVVRVFARAVRDRSVAGAAEWRAAVEGHGDRGDAFVVPADIAGRAGGGD